MYERCDLHQVSHSAFPSGSITTRQAVSLHPQFLQLVSDPDKRAGMSCGDMIFQTIPLEEKEWVHVLALIKAGWLTGLQVDEPKATENTRLLEEVYIVVRFERYI